MKGERDDIGKETDRGEKDEGGEGEEREGKKAEEEQNG